MLSQIFQITMMNLRNIPSRLGSSSVVVVGIAGVVAVLLGLLSMATGFSAALNSTSAPDRALILRDGSNGEMSSGLGVGELSILKQLKGLKAVSGELYAVADLPKKDTNTPANVVVRGVEAAAFEVRPEIQVVAGRNFETGRSEVIVGIKAAHEFAGLQIGDAVEFRGNPWQVVGHFTANGSAYESEVWADLPMSQSAYRRGGSLSSVRAVLDDPAQAKALAEQITADPRLDLSLKLESEHYAEQSQSRTTIIESFGYVVAVIMAVGAVFAALNTMYAAVSGRTVEIATLRALGFGNTPVVISVLVESLALALLGGLIGAALVYFAFDGYTASTLNNASFSQVAFDFAVTPDLINMGIVWALILGFVGGLFPALRAARLPITAALRGE